MRLTQFLSAALLLLAAACSNNEESAPKYSGPSCQGSSLVCHNGHKSGGHGGQHG
jgi:hypothetical protein